MNPDTRWESYVPDNPHTSEWAGYGPESWPPNLAVKWVTAPTTIFNYTTYLNTAPSHFKIMQSAKIPSMGFLNCKPIIEQTDAKVTIAHNSG
jgi:hypothetical protein